MRNKTTAALFALILGGFGVHKFYLRDTGSGIFYIMLTIFSASLKFPIATILGWIDAMVLFSMSQERFDKKYNSRNQTNQRRAESRTAGRNPYQQRQEENYDYRAGRNEPKTNPYQTSTRKTNIIKDNPFKASGIKRIKDFELDLAEQELLQAAGLSPDDQEIQFELGKLYSMIENKNKSFYHLSKAVQLGFSDTKQFGLVDELAYLRIQPEFEAFENSGFRNVPSGAPKEDPNIQITQTIDEPTENLILDDLLLSQLNKLQELRNKGLLSESEFEQEKTKLTRQ